MGRKSQWEVEQDKLLAKKKKAIKSLTEGQLRAIKKTHKAIETVLMNIREVEDIYLSDIRELDNCVWKLNHAFNLEEN